MLLKCLRKNEITTTLVMEALVKTTLAMAAMMAAKITGTAMTNPTEGMKDNTGTTVTTVRMGITVNTPEATRMRSVKSPIRG